jgi:hypothetical protein
LRTMLYSRHASPPLQGRQGGVTSCRSSFSWDRHTYIPTAQLTGRWASDLAGVGSAGSLWGQGQGERCVVSCSHMLLSGVCGGALLERPHIPRLCLTDPLAPAALAAVGCPPHTTRNSKRAASPGWLRRRTAGIFHATVALRLEPGPDGHGATLPLLGAYRHLRCRVFGEFCSYSSTQGEVWAVLRRERPSLSLR